MCEGISAHDERERADRAFALNWIDSGAPLWRTAKPATPNPHLVSYFLLVDGDHCLLVDHRNAQLWLPTGGHVEPFEHPLQTVERECPEELGIAAHFVRKDPLFITVSDTVGHSAGHTDVSFWYVLQGDQHAALRWDAAEFYGVQWFAKNDLPLHRCDPNLGRFVAKLTRP